MNTFRASAEPAKPKPVELLEPRECPTPGACSCPTAPIVPPDVIHVLERVEADLSQHLPRIRQVLKRWRERAEATPLAQPEPVEAAATLLQQPTPIPVSERLPVSEDCAPWPGEPDCDPWCWAAKDVDGGWEWTQLGVCHFISDLGRVWRGTGYTHWLPHWAIPLPQPTTETP